MNYMKSNSKNLFHTILPYTNYTTLILDFFSGLLNFPVL